MSLYFLKEADSTNSLLRREAANYRDGDAVFTDNQTAGKGRLGRRWENRPGEGLYYSLLVRRPMADPASFPLLASLAAADAVRSLTGQTAGVKWPNDLLLGGKKITGILCESVQGMGEPVYICGIGVNINQPQSFFDEQGLDHGGSLLTATGSRYSVQEAAAALHAALLARLDDFAREGFPGIAEEYRSVCINLGRTVWTDEIRGIAEAIDDAGRLVVRTADGTSAVFTGEVSVKGIY